MRGGEGSARRSLEQIPRCLHRIEASDLECPLYGVGLLRAGDRKSNGHSTRAQVREILENSAIIQNPALKRRRVNLIQAEVGSQNLSALGKLTAERTDRKVLHLMDRGVYLPIRRIGVAPFRPNRDLRRLQSTALQPP